MAVEIAKLSLWLVSMDPRRPFTFVDDRLVTGDSLLGITSAEQLGWMHLDARRAASSTRLRCCSTVVGGPLAAQRGRRDRLGLVNIAGSDIEALNKKRQISPSPGQTEELTHYADLIAGAALAGSRRGTSG